MEIWFNIIAQSAIRRGAFRSVKELVAKIENFVAHYYAKSKPFRWTATRDSILGKTTQTFEWFFWDTTVKAHFKTCFSLILNAVKDLNDSKIEILRSAQNDS